MVVPVQEGERYEIELDDLAYGGDAVGRIENFAIFVSGGIPGEKVLIGVTEVKKNYGRGEIIKIIEPSPSRVSSPCPVAQECGGCQLKHISYRAQLELKEQMVKDVLKRIGGISAPVKPVLGMESPRFYRNKARYALGCDEEGQIRAGFYAPGTHRVVEHDLCQIQHPLTNRLVREILPLLDELNIQPYNRKKDSGYLKNLFIRVGVCSNQLMLVLVTAKSELPEQETLVREITDRVPELVSIYQEVQRKQNGSTAGGELRKLWGQDSITDYIGDLKFRISPHSFFQVNTLQTRVLYDRVAAYAALAGRETVLDAYCGIGTIALYLAEKAEVVYGVEVVEEAVADAEMNAALNKIDNVFFYKGRVEDVIPALEGEIKSPDIIVVDPPRGGCVREFLDFCAKTRPERMVYVSCNPSTLARDLKRLKEMGMEPVEVQPVDMFPHTYHVELVVLIKRKYSV